MRMKILHMRGNVLPTAVAATMIITVGMLGLVALWEREHMADLHLARLRQARADAESAYLLYCLHPDNERIVAPEGYRLYDSATRSHVYVKVEPWGLYDVVSAAGADSLARICRITGVRPDGRRALYYADNGNALGIAGTTRLQGDVYLPQNGVVYASMESEFYDGPPIAQSCIFRSEAALPRPDSSAVERLQTLPAPAAEAVHALPDSLHVPFSAGGTVTLRVGSACTGDCDLSGRIVLCGDEIRIDSTCRLHNVVVRARKVTVAAGARITAQIIADDTVEVRERARLQYPSGICAGRYAALGDGASLDGYAIVCDTVHRTPPSANYCQRPTARMRGLLYVDGTADVQGVVTGYACLAHAVRFAEQGYYKDMLYRVVLRPNPVTAHPIWIAAEHTRRKEAACVD